MLLDAEIERLTAGDSPERARLFEWLALGAAAARLSFTRGSETFPQRFAELAGICNRLFQRDGEAWVRADPRHLQTVNYLAPRLLS
jgi:aminoglycoside/choline kinase family phosphotransferase